MSEEKRMRKPRARGHGEGSVFRRKTGNRNKPWVAQITLPNRKKHTVGYFHTEREAIAARNQALTKQQQGKLPLSGSRQTVGHYLKYWVENVQKLTVKLTSYIKYQGAIQAHLLPALGHIPLSRLTRQEVQAFYGMLQSKGLSASRIRFIHATLHKALADAVEAGLLAMNVSQGVKLPRLPEQERPVLSPDQAQRFLEAAHGHWLEHLFMVAIATGMRHGELVGLKWKDVHLEEGYLQVQRSLQHVPGYGTMELEPKTRQSKRRIILPAFLQETLKQQRSSLIERREKQGAAWEENDLVFPNTFGRSLHDKTLTEVFKHILKVAGLPAMRFHDLRHSAATILLMKGVPAKVVQELLGHSDIKITLRVYGHVLPGMHGQAMEIMGDALKRGRDVRAERKEQES